MVLLGYEGIEDAAAVTEALSTNQELTQRRQAILNEPVTVVTRDCGLTSVHILAEEMAFVAPAAHQVDLVASDDATTCSIVLLISDEIVAVAHLDAIYQMAFILKKWESLVHSAVTRVGIAGGYDDERGISRPISMDILQTLMSSEAVYSVQQYVAGRWNTMETDNGVKLPRTRGIGYYPVADIFRCVEFEPDARLPLVPLRFAGVSPHPLHTLLCCLEEDKPFEITVGPYYSTLVSSEICPYMLDLDDDELLPRISTSPFAEGPKFLQDMRDMLKFISTCSLRSLGDTFVLTMSPRQ
ncbi:Protein N-terminal asparagine amidohydrolase [Phytophthora infestans]|uniref:Protein N-terminal asparagine amidohydrolase n=1 Tax=Phytophthora infestans TaxID=4787 RepID=A0A8S9UAT2_PHYIN|nr:Protein N-terminal asparagine amidohydrolase [Phytophthora infestans]